MEQREIEEEDTGKELYSRTRPKTVYMRVWDVYMRVWDVYMRVCDVYIRV